MTPRQEARALGLKHYYTNKPCTRGHDSMRITRCGSCLRCRADNAAASRAKPPTERPARGWFHTSPDRAAMTAHCQALSAALR